MFRKLVSISLIVFVLSLFLWTLNVSFADESDDRAIDAAMDFAENKADDVDDEIDKLKIMKDAMNVMMGKWEANKSDIVSGVELTLVGALGTTASVAANIFSGGTLTVTTKTAGLFTLKKAIDAGMSISAHSRYVDAMESAINAVDTQIEVIEKAQVIYSQVYDDDPNTYNGAYERYLKQLATHTGWTAEDIDERVNTSDTDDDKFPHKNSLTPSHKHFGDERSEFSYEDLPDDYECEGPCDNLFKSPHKALTEHRETCGNGKKVDKVVIEYISVLPASLPGIGSYSALVTAELRTRKVDQGCGRYYYNCPDVPDTEHQKLTCTKKLNGTEEVCGASFRNCMGHERGHRFSWLETKHSADSSTEQQSVAPTPTPTPVLPTDLSPDCNYCTTGGCSACPTLGACGHTYSPSEASSHSAQASCSGTDSYGNSCTATGFYACQTHTHQFPTGKCNRGPCTIPVSYATQHKLTCLNGHTYWSCVSWQHEYHRTRNPCTREKWTPWEWSPILGKYKRFWRECGETWANCDTRCRDGDGAVGQHQ